MADRDHHLAHLISTLISAQEKLKHLEGKLSRAGGEDEHLLMEREIEESMMQNLFSYIQTIS